jgi:hypothetical protein
MVLHSNLIQKSTRMPEDLTDRFSSIFSKFDLKYRYLVSINNTQELLLILDWVNRYSLGSVILDTDTQDSISGNTVFLFENIDDALRFKIKYGGSIIKRGKNVEL